MMGFLTCNYVLHIFLWFMMGIMVKPVISIPIVINVSAVILYTVSLNRKLRELKQEKRLQRYITNREIIITIIAGLVIFMGVSLFLTFGSFAFKSTKNNGYEFIFFSMIPAIVSFITRYVQIRQTIVERYITDRVNDRV